VNALTDLLPMLDQLRFLRPDWFYGFLPLLVFIVLMRKHNTASRSWKSVCDARLLPHVLAQDGDGGDRRLPLLLIAIAASLSLVALAGPVWKKLPQPVFREASALVIGLDLSQSMNATDIKPSRLERAKLKLLDMLDAHRQGQTALVVYAATAFTVTPLTDDTNTIRNLVPTLTTELMPAQGSNAAAALTKASELLRQAGIASGDVLLITDGLGPSDRAAIEKIHAEGHRVSILGVGTADGSPIPLSGGFLKDAGGAIVIPRLQAKTLQQAALAGGGLYTGMRVDDSDINRLEKLFDSARNSSRTEDTDLSADTWREEGPWLLLPVLLLVMLWPRRGWLLLIAICVLPLPQPAWALDLDHLWRSPDQKGMHAFEAGDARQAAEHFNDPKWKAAALYRAGDYAKASELLKQANSSEDSYNRGNALARMGNYPEAVAAYQKALELDANNADARYNLDLVKKQMQQQNQQNSQSDQNSQDDQQSQNQQQSGESSGQQDQDRQDSNEQNKDQQQQEQNASNQQNANQQNQGDQSQAGDQSEDQTGDQAGKQSDDTAEQNRQAEDKTSEQQAGQQGTGPDEEKFGDKSSHDEQQRFAEQMQQEQQQPDDNSEDDQQQDRQKTDDAQISDSPDQATSMAEIRENDDAPMTEDEHASEQLLRRIPDDPGGLMRRKFIYQYRQMPNQTDSEQPW